MVALVLHKKMIHGDIVGFSICEVGFNLFTMLRRNSRFNHIFNDSSPSSNKISKIYHVWGKPVFTGGLNNGIYVMSKETIITQDKDILTKLFELSGQYEMLY